MNMKKIKLIFLTCVLWIVSLQAHIIQTHSFSEILPEIDQDTLVLIDLDQTAITSSMTLNSQAWWDHAPKVWKAEEFYPLIRMIIDKVPQIAVENDIPCMIQHLQRQGITVWSLTGRMKQSPWDNEHDLTTAHILKNVNIDFMLSKIPEGIDLDKLASYPQFSCGMIFTDWKPKGPYLIQFLQTLIYYPKKVLLIDDTLKQLESVEEELNRAGIPFIGFHYLRNVNEKFDPAIGNIQLEALHREGKLLSDEEAKRIKREHPERSPDFYLEELLLQLKQQSGMLTPH